jgi:hypothetical protein
MAREISEAFARLSSPIVVIPILARAFSSLSPMLSISLTGVFPRSTQNFITAVDLSARSDAEDPGAQPYRAGSCLPFQSLYLMPHVPQTASQQPFKRLLPH